MPASGGGGRGGRGGPVGQGARRRGGGGKEGGSKVSGEVLREALRRAATDTGYGASQGASAGSRAGGGARVHFGESLEAGPGEVEPGFLFIGSIDHALSEPLLVSLGITHVLKATAAHEAESVSDSRQRLHLKVRDNASENIAALFPAAIEFICSAEQAKGRCLVHCMGGRSRSVALVLAFLVGHRGTNLAEAWDLMQRARPEAFPNPGFWRQLQAYELASRGAPSQLPQKVADWIEKFGPSHQEVRVSPEAVFSEYLTARLNSCAESARGALASWAETWARGDVVAVLGAAFEKLEPEAREIAVELLSELCRRKQLPVEEAARGLAEFFGDEEYAADLRLDVPQYDTFKDVTLGAARRAGLALYVEQPLRTAEEGADSPRTPPAPPLVPLPAAAADVAKVGGLGPLERTRSAPVPSLNRDHFCFPDGQTWSLPKSWQCGERALSWSRRPAFKLCAFVAVRQEGDAWKDEAGLPQKYHLRSGHEVVDMPMKIIDRPQRFRPRGSSGGGCFLEKPRLLRVLEAMTTGRPLPPVLLEVSGGSRAKVANGFHRYFASLILGFTELPVEVPKRSGLGRKSGGAAAASSSGFAPPARGGGSGASSGGGALESRWVPPSVRRRLEEEAARKRAEKEAARCSRRMEGELLVRSPLLYAEGEASMRQARQRAKTDWSAVVGRQPSKGWQAGEPSSAPGSASPSGAKPRARWRMKTEHGQVASSPSAASSSALAAALPEGGAAELHPCAELPPERFGFAEGAGDGEDELTGTFPLRVIRELHELRRSSTQHGAFVGEVLDRLDRRRSLPRASFRRTVALLSLPTLVAFGLGPEAPERFGLRRVFGPKASERYQGTLSREVLEELTRLTWTSELSADDEDFLKTIIVRASKYGASFFLTRPDFERLLDLRRRGRRLLGGE